ncbi:MAG: hypothetical protein H0W25_16800 [Acidimicrobiia bacterium]|nr:hypothetical protein [Acidimicrobiia bacterium]
MSSGEVQVSLSGADICTLVDALDSHEYWQLADLLPRDNGEVWIPGDLPAGDDRYWDGLEPTREQQEAIDEVRACRALRERLVQALGGVGERDASVP